MTTYTSLLGLALPITGQLSGTWGDTVNDYITQYVDAAVAGAVTVNADTTLTKTTGSSLGATSSQYAIIIASGHSANITVTAPAASKVYLVLNKSGSYTVKIRGAGPTTGITIAANKAALVAWDGSDFALVATNDVLSIIGTLAAANGGTGQSSYAVGDLLYASTTTALSKLADVATGNALISGGVGFAPSYGKIGLTTHVSGTLPAANGGTGVTSLGANIPTFLQTPSSANLAAAVTDETGSGALVFANSPTLGAFNATGNVNLDGGTFVFNDSAADKDARFEGVSDANVIYMDASTNRVGFGTDTPTGRIHILGTGLTSSTLEMESTASSASRPSIVNFTRSTTTGATQLWITNILSRFYNTSSVLTNGSQISSLANNNAGSESCFLQLGALSSVRFGDLSTELARFDSVTGNCKIGGTASRSTTEGTYQLVLFDGTAPSGTLTNGVSFYSSSGEARVMDAAGNSTLLSPHDHQTNEWIFHSKHTPTGKVLRIDVERLLKFVNDHFGLDAVQEFIEE